MRIKNFVVVLLSLIAVPVSAQLSADNFFVSFSSSLYLDIVKSPLRTTRTFVGSIPDPNDPNTTIPQYKNVPFQSVQFSSYSFGIEPRYNIKTLNKDAAIAIAMPISFGIGYATPANDFVKGVTGLGSIQVPLLARFYYGNSSTYETEKDFGVSIGGGLEYNRIGLIGVEEEIKETGMHKGFILPVMSLGVHFWRGNSPFEINVKYGTTKVEEYRLDGEGNQLKDELGNPISKTARGSSFKVSFLYLLNY